MNISSVSSKPANSLAHAQQAQAPVARDPDHDGDVDAGLSKPMLGAGQGTLVDIDA